MYNKRQRNGVFCFMLLLVCIQLGYYIYINRFQKIEWDVYDLSFLNEKIDSLKLLKLDSKKKYPFNPNFIADEKGYALGMSVAEIDRLLAFRNEHKWVNSSREFKEVTKVSDSLLEVLCPLFLFPTKNNPKKITSAKLRVHKNIVKKGINKTTTMELRKIYGIGEKLSARIIKYRNRLGGFSQMSQLHEVYGLESKVVTEIDKYYKVVEPPILEKQNLNTASFKEILSIVYMDYPTTKLLFRYRDSVGELKNLEEIKKIQGFPIEKYHRIALYLRAE
jgi:DNA uptake protein ComE-like DNA-binding protein